MSTLQEYSDDFKQLEYYVWHIEIMEYKREWDFVKWITMTRKSGKHLCVTLGTTRQLFQPYQVWSTVYTMISTTGDRISDHRMHNRNSTAEPITHITYKRC